MTANQLHPSVPVHSEGCLTCGKNFVPLKQCSVCKLAKYCNRLCQESDWNRRHKWICPVMVPLDDLLPKAVHGTPLGREMENRVNYLRKSCLQLVPQSLINYCNNLFDTEYFLKYSEQKTTGGGIALEKLGGYRKWVSGEPSVQFRLMPGELLRYQEASRPYRNVPVVVERLVGGTTHLSIGFCDLSELLFGELEQVSQDAPLRWVGFDLSLLSVGLAKVLVHMLQTAAYPAEVSEVWLSSTWGGSTLTAFRKSVEGLLIVEKDRRIQAILSIWKTAKTVSCQSAFEQWFQSAAIRRNSKSYDFNNWTNPKDVAASYRYLMTGSLRHSPQPSDVGSLVKFCDYRSLSIPNVEHENALQCLSFSPIAASYSEDVIRTATNLILNRIDRLRSLILNNVVQVDAFLGEITPDNAGRIFTDVRPSSVSWSNVLDYFNHQDFHLMAKSSGALLHFGYSTNWNVRLNVAQFSRTLLTTPVPRTTVLEQLWHDAQASARESSHCSLLLRQFLTEEAENLIEGHLARLHHKAWLDAWLAGGSASLVALEPPRYSPVSYCSVSFGFSWRY